MRVHSGLMLLGRRVDRFCCCGLAVRNVLYWPFPSGRNNCCRPIRNRCSLLLLRLRGLALMTSFSMPFRTAVVSYLFFPSSRRWRRLVIGVGGGGGVLVIALV